MPQNNKSKLNLTSHALPSESDSSPAPEKPRRGRKPGQKNKPGKRGFSKSHAVALIVEELGREQASVPDIHEQLVRRFNMNLKSTNISQYKSIYLRKLREGSDPATPEKAPSLTPSFRAAKTSTATHSESANVSVGEIRILKDLHQRIGEKPFRELIDLICS